MDLLDVITPEEFAKRMGWGAKRLRRLAKRIGACHILGNRMCLTKEDVEAVLEATKPEPLEQASLRNIFHRPTGRLPDVTSEDLLRRREEEKRKEEAEKRAKKVQQRRVRLPRRKLPTTD